MISIDRLFTAADALLDAVHSEGNSATMDMLVEEPPEGEQIPDGVFTAIELTEALNMLYRLGLVDDRTLGVTETDQDELTDWA